MDHHEVGPGVDQWYKGGVVSVTSFIYLLRVDELTYQGVVASTHITGSDASRRWRLWLVYTMGMGYTIGRWAVHHLSLSLGGFGASARSGFAPATQLFPVHRLWAPGFLSLV